MNHADKPEPDATANLLKALAAQASQDGEDANTEATNRDQQAWDLNVANGSANAAHIWAMSREHDARAKAWDALASALQVLAVTGFLAALVLLVLDVVKAFR